MEALMKNRKWIWWTLAVILSLIVLAGVGFIGFTVGATHGSQFTMNNPHFMPAHGQGFTNGRMHDGFGMQDYGHGRGFDGRAGFPFFAFPLFGLLRLVFWVGVIWLAVVLIKRSGWRIVNVNSTPAPAVTAAAQEEPSAEDGEKKESE